MKKYAGIKFGQWGRFYTYECKPEKFPTIYLLVDGYWLELRSEDYLIDASDAGDRSLCMFAFTQNTDEFWLLGDVFYRGYYVIHDDVGAKVGIAPHSTSMKRALIHTDEKPTKTLLGYAWTKRQKILMGVGIPVVVILIVLFFLFVWPRIWKWIKKPSKKTSESIAFLPIVLIKD